MPEIFPFAFHVPGGVAPDEGRQPSNITSENQNGVLFRRSDLPTSRYELPEAVVVLEADELGTWESFMETIDHGGTSVLLKAIQERLRKRTGVAVGTAAGGAGESFTLAERHLDAATLVLYDSTGAVIATSAYSLTGNGTTPTIHTLAGFPAGAFTADYEWYREVFVEPRLARPQSVDQVHFVPVSIREVRPGSLAA